MNACHVGTTARRRGPGAGAWGWGLLWCWLLLWPCWATAQEIFDPLRGALISRVEGERVYVATRAFPQRLLRGTSARIFLSLTVGLREEHLPVAAATLTREEGEFYVFTVERKTDEITTRNRLAVGASEECNQARAALQRALVLMESHRYREANSLLRNHRGRCTREEDILAAIARSDPAMVVTPEGARLSQLVEDDSLRSILIARHYDLVIRTMLSPRLSREDRAHYLRRIPEWPADQVKKFEQFRI